MRASSPVPLPQLARTAWQEPIPLQVHPALALTALLASIALVRLCPLQLTALMEPPLLRNPPLSPTVVPVLQDICVTLGPSLSVGLGTFLPTPSISTTGPLGIQGMLTTY